MATDWGRRDIILPGDDAPFIPLADSMRVEPVEGKENMYTGFCHGDWCANKDLVAHGGWCVSLILSTARTYMATRHTSRSQPDPVNIATQFLSPVPAGPLTLLIHPEKFGRSQSILRIELYCPSSAKSSPPSPSPSSSALDTKCITSFVSMANLMAESGPSVPQIPKFELPDRGKCHEWREKWFMEMNPATRRVRTWTPGEKKNTYWVPELGRNRRDQWARLNEPGGGWDVVGLGFLSDLVPAIPLNYHENSLNFFETYAVRTVSLTIDIRRDPKGEEWLLQRAVTYKSMNGRFDIDIKIVDEKGELVASVYQVNLCVPWKKAVL